MSVANQIMLKQLSNFTLRFCYCFRFHLHTVSQKITTDHIFDDNLNYNCPFTKMFGTLITKTIGHRQPRQVFSVSYLAYFVQLLYLGKPSRPKYHQ